MKTVRLPLTIGVDSLWRTAAAMALLVPSGLIVGSGALLVVQGESGGGRILVGVVGLLVSLALLGLAWYARASDVALDDAGLAIHGGWHGGTKLAWEQVGKIVLHNADKPASDLVLEIRTKSGQTYTLAEAADASEKASVAALHETLAAKIGERGQAPAQRTDLATCSHCGAPLAPSEEERVRCGSCGADNPMHPGLRQRVAAHRAAAQAASATSAAVGKLLEQPGARRASAWLIGAGFAATLGWLPVVWSYLLVGVESLGSFEVGLGLFNGWALTFAFFAFARIALAKRRALQLLSTTFGARPPDRPGESPGCRSCGAPLPSTGGIVIRCAYCDTESVLGLNVRPLLREAQAHRESIEDVLRAQRSERSRWTGLGVIGAGATAIGGFWLLVQVVVANEVAEERAGCEKGRADACFEVAQTYVVGSSVEKDDEKAYYYYAAACRLGHAEACSDEAARLEHGWGTVRDESQARAKRAKACELGFKPACAEIEAASKAK